LIYICLSDFLFLCSSAFIRVDLRYPRFKASAFFRAFRVWLRKQTASVFSVISGFVFLCLYQQPLPIPHSTFQIAFIKQLVFAFGKRLV
jgi:hypothetical protein